MSQFNHLAIHFSQLTGNAYIYSMAVGKMIKAMSAVKGIMTNLPAANEAHFRFLEENPGQVAPLKQFIRENTYSMLRKIPAGTEEQHVDIVKRACSALRIPAETPELVDYLRKYDVGYEPQRQPLDLRTVTEDTSELEFGFSPLAIIGTVLIFIFVVVPVFLVLYDLKPGMAVFLMVLLVFTVVRKFTKKAYVQKMKKMEPFVNRPPDRTERPSKTTSEKRNMEPQARPVKQSVREPVGRKSPDMREKPETKRSGRYDQSDRNRKYLK